MKKEQILKLFVQANNRRQELGEASYTLRKAIDTIDTARWDALNVYNEDIFAKHRFTFENKSASAVWSKVEDAIDALYAAANAIDELDALEERKIDKLLNADKGGVDNEA